MAVAATRFRLSRTHRGPLPILALVAACLLLIASASVGSYVLLAGDGGDPEPARGGSHDPDPQRERGLIRSRDGETIAVTRSSDHGDAARRERHYPRGALFGHPVGHFAAQAGSSGLEDSADALIAGADLTVTLDAGAQRVAMDALERAIASTPGTNGAGSVVAIEPATGAIRAMVSIPAYDPNAIRDPDEFGDLAEQGMQDPLFNRATQGVYEPGSTMKVVTAAAALDSGEIDSETTIRSPSPMRFSGGELENFGDISFGEVDATFALANSVNTYWAQVAERLGTDTYLGYLDRFGFNTEPELDFPGDQIAPSGVYSEGNLLDSQATVDVARVGIGQGRLLASPLQMAQVAAVVANRGALMEPTFIEEATDADGRRIAALEPREQARVIGVEAADALIAMLADAARAGTAAGLGVDGVEFAGKTGTVELEAGINRPWFIGFAPVDDPEIAVAAMLERCTGCTGGEIAGPIATSVMEKFVE